MSAEQALLDAYSEWRRLAKAIQLCDWNLLLECQQAVKNLQLQISQFTADARSDWKNAGTDCAAGEDRLRDVIAELMELGQHNQRLLQSARTAAVTRREQVAQAARNLKNLQFSYVMARPAAWNSFS